MELIDLVRYACRQSTLSFVVVYIEACSRGISGPKGPTESEPDLGLTWPTVGPNSVWFARWR